MRRKVFVLQAFFRGNTNRLTSKLALKLLRKRRLVAISTYTNNVFADIDTLDFAYKPFPVCLQSNVAKIELTSRPDLFFQTPGIRQNTPLFESALEKLCVVCLGGRGFGPDDCMLLCTVLRHPLCRTKRIVFEDVDGRHSNFEFDLIQSMGKCVSLRSVVITGGIWNPSFFTSLFDTVQKNNPRIVEVLVESLAACRMAPPELAAVGAGGGKLVADFFNYSVPGLRSLSLHGVGLQDAHLGDLITGLGVNSSITNVILSMNLIEDAGFTGIIKAISSNKRSLVSEVDLCWNLITGLDPALAVVLKKYKNPVFGKTLNIPLQHNHIRFYIDAGDEFRDDLLLTYEIDLSCAGQKKSRKPKRQQQQQQQHRRATGIEHSKSAADMLSPVKPPAHQKNQQSNKTKIKFKSKPLAAQRTHTHTGGIPPASFSSTAQF
jgi:hypothetical protein